MKIEKILVVSLQEDTERRDHIRTHLPTLGLGDFEFVDAVHFNSQQVRDFYKSGKVHGYPTCFRCGKNSCKCNNNIIIPQQVGNWLSFKKVWEYCSNYADSFFLICEDDVAFHENANVILRSFCSSYEPDPGNILVRLSRSGEEPFRKLDPSDFRLTDRIIMSNSAFILNGRMAQLLLEQFDRIETTSDVWVHRRIAPRDDVQAVTIEPLLATDLSYNTDHARFISRIHPKGINKNDLSRAKTHIKRVDSPGEYELVLQHWING